MFFKNELFASLEQMLHFSRCYNKKAFTYIKIWLNLTKNNVLIVFDESKPFVLS